MLSQPASHSVNPSQLTPHKNSAHPGYTRQTHVQMLLGRRASKLGAMPQCTCDTDWGSSATVISHQHCPAQVCAPNLSISATGYCMRLSLGSAHVSSIIKTVSLASIVIAPAAATTAYHCCRQPCTMACRAFRCLFQSSLNCCWLASAAACKSPAHMQCSSWPVCQNRQSHMCGHQVAPVVVTSNAVLEHAAQLTLLCIGCCSCPTHSQCQSCKGLCADGT